MAGIVSATSVRLIPSGVSSNAHAITSAIGNPMMISTMIKRTTQFGISKNGNICGRFLRDYPADNGVSDRDLVNIPPLQLDEEVSRVHSGMPASKRSTSFWKRGSLRSGSRRLSILMLPNKP